MFYKCHNCGHGTYLRGLIELVDSNMASQYGMEHFKEGQGNSEKKERLFEFNTPKFKKKDPDHGWLWKKIKRWLRIKQLGVS